MINPRISKSKDITYKIKDFMPKENYQATSSVGNPEIDEDSGAIIHRVSPNELPFGVLGMYKPSEHAIYLPTHITSRNLGYNETFVKAHESAHALGQINEWKTDQIALAKTGRMIDYLRLSGGSYRKVV